MADTGSATVTVCEPACRAIVVRSIDLDVYNLVYIMMICSLLLVVVLIL